MLDRERYAALRDITPEKTAQQVAEHRVAVEEQFLGIVSHDLKNPLATIIMGSESLLEGELSDRDKKTAAVIHRAGKHGLDLVHDLLDFTRARLGRGIPVDLRVLDVATVCKQAVHELRVAHPARTVELEAGETLPIDGDATRLRQVILNLLENALSYSPSDTPVTVRTTRRSNGHVVLEVQNWGKPIRDERLRNLFEPLRRGGRGSGARKNIGLGLFIVREIVRAHGGEITARSSVESGTSVHRDASCVWRRRLISSNGSRPADRAACARTGCIPCAPFRPRDALLLRRNSVSGPSRRPGERFFRARNYPEAGRHLLFACSANCATWSIDVSLLGSKFIVSKLA